MENDKLKPSGIVGVVSRNAGALAGVVVVTGKKFGLCVRSMMTGEPGPSDRRAKKPVQVQTKKKAKKKIGKTGKKKAEVKRAKIKRKTEKPTRSSRSQSRPKSEEKAETNRAIETKMSDTKSRDTKAPTDSVS